MTSRAHKECAQCRRNPAGHSCARSSPTHGDRSSRRRRRHALAIWPTIRPVAPPWQRQRTSVIPRLPRRFGPVASLLDDRESALDQIGIVEVTAPKKSGRVPPPLAHCTSVLDAGWPEQEPLAALGARHNAILAEGASGGSIDCRERAQIVILGEPVACPVTTRMEAQIVEIV